jgi:hypothetical protein
MGRATASPQGTSGVRVGDMLLGASASGREDFAEARDWSPFPNPVMIRAGLTTVGAVR